MAYHTHVVGRRHQSHRGSNDSTPAWDRPQNVIAITAVVVAVATWGATLWLDRQREIRDDRRQVSELAVEIIQTASALAARQEFLDAKLLNPSELSTPDDGIVRVGPPPSPPSPAPRPPKHNPTNTPAQAKFDALVLLSDQLARLTGAAEPRQDKPNEPRYFYDLQSSFLQQKGLVLARQAMEIIDRHPEQYNSSVYHTVGMALVHADDYLPGERYLTTAAAFAITPHDHLIALRSLASLYYSNGRPDDGRRILQEQASDWSRFEETPEVIRNGEDLSTYELLTRSELEFGDVDVAEAALGRSREIVRSVGDADYEWMEWASQEIIKRRSAEATDRREPENGA